ncbi:chemotaxis protein CheW [Pseudomaricurvus sp. HS19]|uniref:chemotaxis protein CheW n=1 Tax=Pseudomaricurvus sp. HS19 TaxID=2692626 RepID=UPI00136F104D|nr:chemotaxis protein CheW [Pseudomaricurvus sp. HS19]MYM63665.1 chemotaxis protein CheW [Pseudomaricurvus sp. HS19]
MSEDNSTAEAVDQGSRVAYEALASLALQCRSHARGLPAQVDITPQWSGVAFELLGRRFVAPMGEVSEILEVPHYTRIPGVKPWVRGVANVRGRLLPVCDLASFLHDRIHSSRKQQRVLVLELDDLYSGLMVDRVYGMQHFPVTDYDADYEVDGAVAAYCDGCYRVNGVEWAVFNPSRLRLDLNFMQAAQA